jgi:polyisoprenoid-binding protein YceI
MIFRRFIPAIAFVTAFALSNAALAAETYVFDKDHTEIRFSWTHMGINRMSGMMLDFDGALNFDAAAPENSNLRFTGKVNSLWTHVKALDDHLQGPDFFDAGKHPEISFTTTKVEKTGDKTGKITGDLTIKGVTKPVTLDAELNFMGLHPYFKKPTLGFQAKTTIKRSEFKVDSGIPFVSDEIEIAISTEMNQRG